MHATTRLNDGFRRTGGTDLNSNSTPTGGRRRAAAMLLCLAIQMALGAGASGATTEGEILEGIKAGRDVSALVGTAVDVRKLAPRAAARPSLAVGSEFSAALKDLQSGLESWRANPGAKATAAAAYQGFLGADLLMRAHFDDVQSRLREQGFAGRFEDRRMAARARHAALVGKLVKLLDPSLSVKAAPLPGRAPQAVSNALDLVKTEFASAPPRVLRADGLAYRSVSLPPRAPVAEPAITPSFQNPADVAAVDADLAGTAEAPLTDEIIAQARALDNDYVKIFEFVRNNITTQWYAGGMKGATGTLRGRAGNDIDQASLLTALLRAAGLPARYVHGVIELPVDTVAASIGIADARQVPQALAKAGIAYTPVVQGGRVAAVRIEHTWVSALAPYTNYRGVYLDGSGRTWLPLDASIKTISRSPSSRVLEQMGLTANQAIADYLGTDMAQDGQDYIATLRRRVQDYLQNKNGGRYQDQLGAAAVTAVNAGLLPNSLPYAVVAATAESAKLAADRQVRVHLVLRTGTRSTDPVTLDVTTSLQEFVNDRVTLSYMPASLEDHRTVMGFGGMNRTPAYLIQMLPRLRVGGENRYAGQLPLAPGVPTRLDITFLSPAGEQHFQQTVVTGAYHALGFSGNGLTRPATRAPSDDEYDAARLLDSIARQYVQRWEEADRELSGLLGVPVVYPLPSVVLVSNEMRVELVAGNPYTLRWQGVSMDAGMRIAQPLGASAADWMRLSALEGSSLEHALFESQFGVDAVSADKGLQLAQAAGIGLLALSGGDSTALDSTDHPDVVKNDIRGWLRLGYRVTVPAAKLTRNNWSGSVWRVEDPATGGAGYYIAGGLAGGSSTPNVWTLNFLADALAATDTEAADRDPLSAAQMVRLGATDEQEGKAGEDLNTKLAVLVTNKVGAPVIGAPVTFRATQGDGKVDGATTTTVLTNEMGVAEVSATLGQKTSDSPVFVMRNSGDKYATQAGFNAFDADVPGVQGNVPLDGPFTAVGMPGDLAQLETRSINFGSKVVSGCGSGGPIDLIMAFPQDQFTNPISNQNVSFSAGSTTSSCEGGGGTSGAVYDPEACSDLFLVGECGSSTVSLQSSTFGVGGGVIAGAEVGAKFEFSVQSGGFGDTYTYTAGGGCQGYDGSGYVLRYEVTPTGKNCKATKPGKAHSSPDKILFYLTSRNGDKDPTFSQSRTTMEFSSPITATNGGSARVLSNSSAGLLVETTTGMSPGLARPYIEGVAVGSHTTWYGYLPGAWGVVAKIDSVKSLDTPAEVDPSKIMLDGQGHSAYPIGIDFHIEPLAYESILADVELQKNSAWMGYVVSSAKTGSGQVRMPRGDTYTIEDSYTAIPVVNRGDSANEIRGESFTIPITQKIITWYSKSLRLSQHVDTGNSRVCAKGSAMGFVLAREASITLVAIPTSGISKRLIDGQVYPAGANEYPLAPGDLSPGDYSFELTAVATGNGDSETVSGSAEARLTVFNSLPVGQTLVKGVNVRSGALSLSAQSIQIPGRGPALRFQPVFSSGESTTLGPLGVNWTHNYDAGVSVDSCGTVHVNSGDGGSAKFFPQANGTLAPDKGYHATLIANLANRTYDYYSKDGTRYHFTFFNANDQWKLASITDPNGNTTTLEYDPAIGIRAKLLRVVDPAGRAFGFTYASKKFKLPVDPRKMLDQEVIVAMSGPEGISVTFDYDDYGNLTAMDRNGRRQTFAYTTTETEPGLQHNVAEYADPLNQVTHYTYTRSSFSFGSIDGVAVLSAPTTYVSRLVAPDGGVTTYTPDTTTWRTSQVDDVGMGMSYTFNAYGSVLTAADGAGSTSYEWATNDILLLSRNDPGGVVTSYTYDANGNVTNESTGGLSTARTWLAQNGPPYIKNRPLSYTDRNGNTTSYGYDGAGNLVLEARPGATTSHSYGSNGDRASTNDPNGHTTTYSHDGFGNLTSERDALGGVIAMSYDGRSRLTGRTDKRGGRSSFAHDDLDNLISASDPLGGHRTFSYDLAGNRRTETDEEGRGTTYTYDAMNRLTGIRKPLGATKSYQYDTAGSKTSETDWNGNRTGFGYDGARRLSSRTEPGGFITQYNHDGSGNVTTETDPAGHRIHHSYDAASRRTGTVDAEHGSWNFGLDGNGNKTSETDPLGRVTTYVYDSLDRPTKKTQPLGRVTTYSYDAKGNKLSETDPNGNTTRFAYDALDRLTRRTDALGYVTNYEYDRNNNLVTEIDARIHTNQYEYDALNRRTVALDALRNITRYSYDKVGNRTAEYLANGNSITHSYDALNRRIASSDNLGSLGSWTYDAQGNPLSETDGNGNSSSHSYDTRNLLTRSDLPEGRSTARSYHPDATVATETDPRGGTTQYRYDGLKRLTGTTDALGGVTASTYDAVGNKLSDTDRRGYVTRLDYDAANRLVKTTDALGQTQTITYDNNGNRLSETDKRGTLAEHTYDRLNRLVKTIKAGTLLAQIQYDEVGNKLFETDANGNKTGWEYDARNLPIQENGSLAAISRYTLDAMGDRTESRDPEGRLSQYGYDARRRLLRQTNAAGESTSYAYDNVGNRTREAKPRGQATDYTYDGAQRLVKITDALNGVTAYQYDRNGNVSGFTDANGHRTAYTHDLLNRRTGLTHPDGKSIAEGYDANGNRISLTDEAGRITTTTYDALNRETQRSYPNAPGGLASTVTTYDANGNVLTVTETDAAGSRQSIYAYDPYDRIVRHTDPWGKTASYLYDANGNRTALTGPDGKTTRYGYDALNRLIALTTDGGVSQFQYDRSSLPTVATQPNGVTTVTDYDLAQRPTRVSHGKAGNTLLAYAYRYDQNGNKTGQTETRPGQAERTSTYTYDALDRLVQATEPEGSTDTSYDAVGNRLSEQTASGTTTYTYNARNQLTDIGGNTSATLAYEATGNLQRKTIGGSQTDYAWNIRDQLIAVSQNGVEVAAYTYDAAGLRIEKKLPSGTTRSLWDGRQPFIDTDADGNPVARFETNGRHPVQAQTQAGRRYYGLDALGSATLLTDTTGSQTAFTRYDPWGRTESQEGSPTKLGYTGHEMDGESGLIYFKARHYDPQLGRFISEDPYEGQWGTPMSLHRYLYAYANPMVYVDLNGYYSLNDFKDDTIYTSGFVVGLAHGVATSVVQGAAGLAEVYADSEMAKYGDAEAAQRNVERGRAIAHAVTHPIETAQKVGQYIDKEEAGAKQEYADGNKFTAGIVRGHVVGEVATVVVPATKAGVAATVGKLERMATKTATTTAKVGATAGTAEEVAATATTKVEAKAPARRATEAAKQAPEKTTVSSGETMTSEGAKIGVKETPKVDGSAAPELAKSSGPAAGAESKVICGSGGNCSVYEIPASELKAEKPYIGKTRRPIPERMGDADHRAKTPTGTAPKARPLAENLTPDEAAGLESLLAHERGLENLSNKIRPLNPDLPKNAGRIEAGRKLLEEARGQE